MLAGCCGVQSPLDSLRSIVFTTWRGDDDDEEEEEEEEEDAAAPETAADLPMAVRDMADMPPCDRMLPCTLCMVMDGWNSHWHWRLRLGYSTV